MRTIFIGAFFVLFLIKTNTTQAQCLKNDSLELIKLYKATNGANWTNKWDLSKPVNTWHGVGLTSSGCNVETIKLTRNRLTGSIPDLHLPELENLYFNYNKLTGSIPNLDFPNLENLSIYNNQLSGAIPNLDFPNLENLSIYNNQLSGAIPNFDLPKLKDLVLDNNKLSGTIPNFDSLPNLEYLSLESNQLNGEIPNFDLQNIGELELGHNQLSGTIPNFDNLPKLGYLYLPNNKLSGTIPNFDNLPGLQQLNVSNNQLTGAIPNFDNLPNVYALYLFHNQLTGTIPNFDHLPKLWYLWVFNNKLHGPIPDFNKLPELNDLRMSYNAFTFEGIAEHLNIRFFYYQYQDTIPIYQSEKNKFYVKAGGDVKKNTYYWYKDGIAYDTIAADSVLAVTEPGTYYCKVTNSVVTKPDVQYQNLVLSSASSTVNTQQSPCLKRDSLELIKLYKATNGANWTKKWDLSKPVNTWYGVGLTSSGCNVEKINLSSNALSGTIPYIDLPELKNLYLYYNELTGSIPNYDLPKLEKLYLYNNQLSGAIPNFNLPSLESLDLDYNQLSGAIPNFDLPKLGVMSLYNNKLSGVIPNFDNLPAMWNVDFRKNKLSGTIPNFDNLSDLQVLHLSDNQLSGAIPNFDNLQNLWSLDLGANKLSGSIAEFHLPNLKFLNVYNNQLSGAVPNLDFLNGLDIRQNNFTFDGIEQNLTILAFYYYENQNIIPITYTIAKNELYVKAEGGVNNNTYNWYKDGKKYKTIKGDSVLIAKEPGTYYCKVTNSVVTRPYNKYQNLVLQSAQAVVNEKEIINHPISCLKHDSLELIKLYKATNGANWANKWDLSKPVSTWHRVKLTADGCHVRSLYLSYNKLRGNIPNLNLPELQVLSLDNNQLKGIIPNFVLPELVLLSLKGNQLTGPIPDFDLSKLEVLYLSNNHLSGGIPRFNLPNLEDLDLRENIFTFQGIEENLSQHDWALFAYENQGVIPIFYRKNLYVNAGGNVKNNIYNWHKDGRPYKKIIGNNNLRIRKSGEYYCKVTNKIVTRKNAMHQNLILKSNLAEVEINRYGTFVVITEIRTKTSKNLAHIRKHNRLNEREEKEGNSIALFPNPAKQSVSIRLKGTKGKLVDIEVLDRFGRLHMMHSIQPLTNEVIKLNVRSLSNGYYYVRILVEGKKVVVKPLIIAH